MPPGSGIGRVPKAPPTGPATSLLSACTVAGPLLSACTVAGRISAPGSSGFGDRGSSGVRAGGQEEPLCASAAGVGQVPAGPDVGPHHVGDGLRQRGRRVSRSDDGDGGPVGGSLRPLRAPTRPDRMATRTAIRSERFGKRDGAGSGTPAARPPSRNSGAGSPVPAPVTAVLPSDSNSSNYPASSLRKPSATTTRPPAASSERRAGHGADTPQGITQGHRQAGSSMTGDSRSACSSSSAA